MAVLLCVRALLQYSDGGQGVAVEELEKSPASVRKIPHLVGNTIFGNGSQSIAAASNGKTFGFSHRLRYHLGPIGKGVKLEHAHRPIPYDRAGLFQNTGQLLCRVRANRSEEHTSELKSPMRISYAVFCLKNKI